MTREQAIALREAFNGFCEGKEVQFRGLETDRQWVGTLKPLFSEHVEWRVKPEPMDVWMVRADDQKYYFDDYQSAVKFRAGDSQFTVHHLKEGE